MPALEDVLRYNLPSIYIFKKIYSVTPNSGRAVALVGWLNPVLIRPPVDSLIVVTPNSVLLLPSAGSTGSGLPTGLLDCSTSKTSTQYSILQSISYVRRKSLYYY
jgi:hypothetical protein